MIPGVIFGNLLVLACCLGSWAAQAQVSSLKRDEQIVFYPACAWESSDGNAWWIEVNGCVYEPEGRRLALALLREALAIKHIEITKAQEPVFAERARLFMVDNERHKRVVIRLGNRIFSLGQSAPNGHFSGSIRLSKEEMGSLVASGLSGNVGAKRAGRMVEFAAVMPAGDERQFRGVIQLCDPAGWFVISDIDDTIKITCSTDSRAAVRNTLLEPFQPVPGMARLYQNWASSNAHFFYVSASPWQLYLPLSDFMSSNSFPAGVFQMKLFRLKDRTRASLLEGPEKYKPPEIEKILKRFPNGRFVLVGDSGERDPEIYAALARKHPNQIARVLIRNATGQGADAPRYQQTFRDLPREVWDVFDDPATVSAFRGMD